MSRITRHPSLSRTRKPAIAMLASLLLSMMCTPSVVQAESIAPPPPAPSEAAEGGAPPPPQADPLAPALLNKRIRMHYASVVYPAYLAWLGTSNGLPNTAATFGMFLTFQSVSPHERYCFMRCYLEMHG